MASSSISSGNLVTDFQKQVNKVYVRKGKFGPYIGPTENDIIQTNNNLKKKEIALIGKLSSAGVRGSTTLVGSEEALSNFDFSFQPTYLRNGVLIDNEEREKSAFDLYREARPALMNWMMETKRDQIIQAFGAVMASGTYYNYGGTAASGAYGSSAAATANMDTWNTNNIDRVLYGNAVSNYSAGAHGTSLGNIATTAKLGSATLSLAKRRAMTCNPLIRPVMIKEDEPHFVCFTGLATFRDLRTDSTLLTSMQEALPRAKSNPLFQGGDLLWDGIVIKEIPDMDKFIDNTTGTGLWDGVWGANATGDSLLTSGGSSGRIGPSFLCGTQAVAFGRGRNASFSLRKEDDYGHLDGVACTAKHDIKKIFYSSNSLVNQQFGMVTMYNAAASD
jgi:hypothetical protein